MDYRTPLQHLFRTLLPARHHTEAPATPPAFADTCRDVDADTEPVPLRSEAGRAAAEKALPAQRALVARAGNESAIDLVLGTEVMEYPEDTAADLMDEFFTRPEKKKLA